MDLPNGLGGAPYDSAPFSLGSPGVFPVRHVPPRHQIGSHHEASTVQLRTKKRGEETREKNMEKWRDTVDGRNPAPPKGWLKPYK